MPSKKEDRWALKFIAYNFFLILGIAWVLTWLNSIDPRLSILAVVASTFISAFVKYVKQRSSEAQKP